jgi:hypothetical protein
MFLSSHYTLLFHVLPVIVMGRRPIDVYWNVSNPLFSQDAREVVIAVNENTGPWDYDQVHCKKVYRLSRP